MKCSLLKKVESEFVTWQLVWMKRKWRLFQIQQKTICWNISRLTNNAPATKMKQSYWGLYTRIKSENTANRRKGLHQANWCHYGKTCQFGSTTLRGCLMDVIIEDVSTCSKSNPKWYAMLISFSIFCLVGLWKRIQIIKRVFLFILLV